MIRLLSTRLLDPASHRVLTEAGISCTDYPALKFEHILRVGELGALPLDSIFICTSSQAVAALKPFVEELVRFESLRAFAVGDRTGQRLKDMGFTLLGKRPNARTLGELICSEKPGGTLVFLCGDRSLRDLPGVLNDCGLSLREIVAYKTRFNPRSFSEKFDALLFFSPSGVRSFTESNRIGAEHIFCLGPTTASEARAFSDRILVSPEPRVESLVRAVVSYYGAGR